MIHSNSQSHGCTFTNKCKLRLITLRHEHIPYTHKHRCAYGHAQTRIHIYTYKHEHISTNKIIYKDKYTLRHTHTLTHTHARILSKNNLNNFETHNKVNILKYTLILQISPTLAY